jgi:hypothetical protein
MYMLMTRTEKGSSLRGMESSINLSTVILIFPRSRALMFARAATGAKYSYGSPRAELTTRIVMAK